MDFEAARFNMVEQQIRPWEVLDQRVLNVLSETPREKYVPAEYQELAFADTNIPLPEEQLMMRPNVEGRMLQALAIQPSDVVLEVGTGSGYITACLAQLAEHVYSVDIFSELSEQAEKTLRENNISNITLSTGDASSQWEQVHKYNVIALTGSVTEIPEFYKSALAVGGRLFAIVGNNNTPIMEAKLITRTTETEWTEESLFETIIPPLINTLTTDNFSF